MRDVHGDVEQMAPAAKRALLARLLRERLQATRTIYPLSFSQESMWFLHQMDRSSAAYNVALATRVRGAVDISLLVRVFQTLVDRYAALRTTFVLRDDHPVQQVWGYRPAHFEHYDVSAGDPGQTLKEVAFRYRRPFDLQRGPLLRTTLFTEAPGDHVLLVTAHHIVCDGWSVWILLDEFKRLYEAGRAGQPLVLAPVKAQQADFAAWQSRLLAGPDGARLAKYWAAQLPSPLPVLDLPFDHPRVPGHGQGASLDFELGPERTHRLREAALTAQTTLYTTLLAAFQIWLHQLTGQDRILVGSPVSGRSQARFSGVVGNLINMVVIRGDFAPGMTIADLVAQMRRTVLAALEHQDYPFRLLVEHNGVRQTPGGRTPVFQATFDLQRLGQFRSLTPAVRSGRNTALVSVGDLVLEPFALPQQEGQYDLALQIVDVASDIYGVLRYDAALFDAATMEGMLARYLGLLDIVAQDPQHEIADLARSVQNEPRNDSTQGANGMTLTELIARLEKSDIRVRVEGERLRISAPKGALTAELQAELGRLKPELIEFLRRASEAPASKAPAIARAAGTADWPLSFSQQRLWFIDRMSPGISAYNLAGALWLHGALDTAILERVLNQIVLRHQALRANFAAADGQPVQQISEWVPFQVPVETVEYLPPEEREPAARARATDEIRMPFDLERDPLYRFKLLRLDAHNHLFVVVVHHIVSDAWSLGVIGRELRTLYGAFLAGQPSPLPELPIQYTDYARWQRDWLQGDVLAADIEYWKQTLGGQLPVLELPCDHPRSAEQTYRGSLEIATFPPELTEAVKALACQENATLFMALVAAFDVWLSRTTGLTDVLVGTPANNRSRSELEGLIGMFVNTLVLRTDLSGNPTFREIVRRVRQVALGAFAHQQVPFEALVDALHVGRDTGHTPLFQVMFSMQNVPFRMEDLPGITARPEELDTGAARLDLTVDTWDKPDGLTVMFEHRTDLFDQPTMARMLRQFRTVLESAAAHPDWTLQELCVIPDDERRRLLVDWNATQLDYPQDACLHNLFETMARRQPDAIALVAGDLQLSYRELDARANQLARHLHDQGVGPDVLVGISLDRSAEMVIACLGVLKAGGAYVPLDPAHPRGRLEYVLRDAGVGILVTQDAYRAMFSDVPCVVCVDTDGPAIANRSAADLPWSPSPCNLAYVIYTSGSTGNPKGVQIEHRAVVNLLTAMQREPGITARDTLLGITTLSFDIAGLEIYLPLTVGARVVIAAGDIVIDGGRLLALLRDSGATIMQATPATWHMLLASGWSTDIRIAKILCGGEPLTRDLAEHLLQRCDQLWNVYGPTETTIWSTAGRVHTGDPVISIGRPIANTQVYVLDAAQQPVPTGVVGELYIGGDGVARGYLNRSDLTAERFLPNPFVSDPQARLYRTGDLVRYLADGRLECLGRVDFQVKVRGFRIELEEIETQLVHHPGVRQAAVLVRDGPSGDKRLAACVIAGQNPAPAPGELRAFLRERLPEYMVPAQYHFVEEFPLTPNRKIDRRALVIPETLTTEAEGARVAPGTEIERVIVDIWKQVLRVDQIGVQDNFFDLGGHSLLIVQVQSKLRKALNREVAIADMFRYPTVRTLATYLSRELIEPASLDKSNERARQRQQALERRAIHQKQDRKSA